MIPLWSEDPWQRGKSLTSNNGCCISLAPGMGLNEAFRCGMAFCARSDGTALPQQVRPKAH